MKELGYFMFGACCTAFLVSLFEIGDDLSTTKNNIRKDIITVEDYMMQYDNCKKHNMQVLVAKNKANQVVGVLCTTGTEVLKSK